MKKRAITAATYNVIVQIGSLIGSRTSPCINVTCIAPIADKDPLEIYRAEDAPYYFRGNKVLISICALSLVTFIVQREVLRMFNRRKERVWKSITVEERAAYQADKELREREGNRRLDFRFKY